MSSDSIHGCQKSISEIKVFAAYGLPGRGFFILLEGIFWRFWGDLGGKGIKHMRLNSILDALYVRISGRIDI